MISSKFARPHEKIIGLFNFKADSIKGRLLKRPDDILIAGMSRSFNLFKDERSPGCKKPIPIFLKILLIFLALNHLDFYF